MAEHWSVCVCACSRSWRQIEGLSCCGASPLWGNAPEQNWRISQIKLSTERERTDSDAYLAPFSVLNQHIRRRKRSHYMMVVLSKLWLCQRLNESVFILIEEFYITEVSFTCSPGKRMFQVFVFFIQKAQSPLLKQFNHLYLYILGLLGCTFVLKDCYWVSVCRKNAEL